METKDFIKFASGFNTCKDDIERWKYILSHPGYFLIILDSDDTIAVFSDECCELLPEDEREDLPELNRFDDYIGDSMGIHDLLSVLNIKHKNR